MNVLFVRSWCGLAPFRCRYGCVMFCILKTLNTSCSVMCWRPFPHALPRRIRYPAPLVRETNKLKTNNTSHPCVDKSDSLWKCTRSWGCCPLEVRHRRMLLPPRGKLKRYRKYIVFASRCPPAYLRRRTME